MNVGIMTFWGSVNYGAFLQAYALVQKLNREEGINAEIINFRMKRELNYYTQELRIQRNFIKVFFNIVRYEMFKTMQKALILSDMAMVSDSIDGFVEFVSGKYDVVIAGSDEVWKIDDLRGFPNPYFLFGDIKCAKMSYAASGRDDFSKLDSDQIRLLRENLREFKYIGVRDKKTYDSINDIVGDKKVFLNLDPTLTYGFSADRERGRKLLEKKFGVRTNNRCIGVMYTEQKPSKPILAKWIDQITDNRTRIIPLYDWVGGYKNRPDLTPFDLVDIISALDGLVSMYYHGVCISIITQTPVWAIESRANSNETSKLYDLVSRFNMSEYYSFSLEKAINSKLFSEFIVKPVISSNCDRESIIENDNRAFGHFVDEIKSL